MWKNRRVRNAKKQASPSRKIDPQHGMAECFRAAFWHRHRQASRILLNDNVHYMNGSSSTSLKCPTIHVQKSIHFSTSLCHLSTSLAAFGSEEVFGTILSFEENALNSRLVR